MTALKYFALIIFFLNSFSIWGQEEDVIIWSKEKKINWDFFKGQEHSAKPNQGAAIYSGITIETHISTEDNIFKVSVFAEAFSSKSWVKAEAISDELLTHEQKHFDLSEVYARQLRSKIKSEVFTFNTVANRLNSLFDDYSHKLKKMQEKYDKETQHGLNSKKQSEWNNQIESWLNEWKDFSNPEVNITIKN